MSAISVGVIDARAVLDEDEGTFVLQARLANGKDVKFSSHPSVETIAELKDAMLTPLPEPVKPKRRRTTKKRDTAEN